jgi:hypothetical protein
MNLPYFWKVFHLDDSYGFQETILKELYFLCTNPGYIVYTGIKGFRRRKK